MVYWEAYTILCLNQYNIMQLADWEMYMAQGLLAEDEDVKSQLEIG